MAKQAPNIVVQNITVKPIVRKSQDIENWKNAIKQFGNLINPNRILLYDLYDDILLDGQIESTWGKRQDAILNKELLFVNDGNEDEEINKLLNCSDMRRLMKELHNSIIWGYTLIQINNVWLDEEEEQYHIAFDTIPRKHIHPERNFECISKDQSTATKDFLYKIPPLSKYMLWAGESEDMGLLVKASQYVIYKRGDFGDWAQYAEMFGMPFREARYDDYDEKTRIALERMLQVYGGAGYAILPKGAEFKLHESSGSGSNTLYKDLYDACNAEISKLMLGNTLTTEQGDNGARSLGEVHLTAEEAKNKSDEKLILDVLNGKFRSILKVFGFNIAGGNIWFKSPDKDWKQLKTKWEVISGISQEVPVDDDYIYEEFDIPKPDNYDELRAKKDEGVLNSIEKVLNPDKNTLSKTPTNSLIERLKSFFV